MAVPGASASALDIIKGALRSINVLASGEEPTGDEAQDALVILNQMIDSWNADGLMIFTIQQNDFPLIASQQLYTLGTGGDFDMARPLAIDRASIILLSNPLQPLEVPIPVYTVQDWQEKVPIKNPQGTFPLLVYDDGSFPLRNLTFWPVPTDNVKFRCYTWLHLDQFTNLVTVNSYPPGYMEAIRYNLAIRLAPDFNATTSSEVQFLAVQAIARVKTSNPDDTQLRSDLSSSATPSRMRSELFNIP